MLPLLLGLEPEPREPAEVLFAHCFVYSGAAPDTLAVVVRDVGPPVRLVFQQYILADVTAVLKGTMEYTEILLEANNTTVR